MLRENKTRILTELLRWRILFSAEIEHANLIIHYFFLVYGSVNMKMYPKSVRNSSFTKNLLSKKLAFLICHISIEEIALEIGCD